MKVLYIVTAFERYKGDVITPWLTKLLIKLNKKLIADVYTSSYKGMGSKKIYNINVYRFRYFFSKWENLTHDKAVIEKIKEKFIYKLLIIFYIIFGSIGIVNLCKIKKYNIIHVHWPIPHALFGYLAKKICKAKMVLSFHGVELMVFSKIKAFQCFIKWAISNSEAITANSSYTAEKIRELKNVKIHIVPFGSAISNE